MYEEYEETLSVEKCWCGVLIIEHVRDISELHSRKTRCCLTQEEVRAMRSAR